MDSSSLTPRRDIILLGGSLGGTDALRTILSGLPSELPAAVLIVIHAGTSSPKMLASILDRYTQLPVAYGKHGETIQHGRVYLAEPDHHLEIIEPGVIQLSDGPRVMHSRPSVDRLFMTAAATYGDRIISVILSGGSADGTEGAKAIYKAGGLTFVQDPEEAIAPGMPIHAIKYDHPVKSLKAREIAGELMQAMGMADTHSLH